MKANVLVVDDEEPIHRFLRPALIASGFGVLTALTGQQALHLIAAEAPDIVLLDLGLSDMDGKELIAAVRQFSEIPIIVISARDSVDEKIAAFDLGANDYVLKPFGIGELISRIKAALRDTSHRAKTLKRFEIGGLVIDLAQRSVHRDGVRTHLTPKEFLLLSILAGNSGAVITHQQILAAVWGPTHGADVQTLRVMISQLRAKIEEDTANPTIIGTEPGVGYRLQAED